ncbi:MAG: type VI secretion system protein TssA [Deltaproteobacteria bacterium]|nr:type VI secretion system protein TssA [Deltaproteobacteria bacterium]
MASPESVDFNALMTPVPGENPAGESLRYAGTYDAIQEARRADEDLPQGEWAREIKTADWGAVKQISVEALATKSKDLQIAAWLVEALVKRHGFPGLRDGLRLLRELQEQFWPSLYPVIEDGDLEFRAGPLEWLNEKLPPSIRELPVTQGGEDYSWLRWEESRTVDNLARQNPDAIATATAEGKIAGEQFDKAVSATPRSFYETLLEDITQSREEFARVEQVTDENFGKEAPSLKSIQKAIEDCLTLVEGIVKKKREQDPNYRPAQAAGEEAGAESAPIGAEAAAGQFAGGVFSLEPQSREDAFRRLAAIAAYLKRTEPQSPVSYLLERAVRWTKMPLEEWLGEVIRNDDVLSHLRDTLGIKDRQGT